MKLYFEYIVVVEMVVIIVFVRCSSDACGFITNAHHNNAHCI